MGFESAELVRDLAKLLVILVLRNAQGGGPERFSVVGGRERAVVDADELIQGQLDGLRRLRSEEWVNKNRETH